MSTFKDFIHDQKIVGGTISLLIALQLKEFTAVIIDSVITPLITLIYNTVNGFKIIKSMNGRKNINDFAITIGGVTFPVGNVINISFRVTTVIFLIFLLYRLM